MVGSGALSHPFSYAIGTDCWWTMTCWALSSFSLFDFYVQYMSLLLQLTLFSFVPQKQTYLD